MKNKEIIRKIFSSSQKAGLILGLLLALLMVPHIYSVSADFYITRVAPETVEPGETTSLDITMKNMAPNYAVYMNANLDPDDVSPIDALGAPKKYVDRVEAAMDSEKYFGIISQGEEIHLSLPIRVKQNASDGVYQVPLVLEWKDEKLEDNTQTVYMGINVEKHGAEFTVVEIKPSKIEPEVTTELKINLINSGSGNASNIKATLDPEDTSPVNVLGSPKLDIEAAQVAPNEEFVISYIVHTKSGQVEDVYDIPLRLEWEDISGIAQTADLEIGIQINGDALLRVVNIKTTPVELKPDTEKAEITITVENAGKTPAKSVKVNAGLQEPFSESYSSSAADFVAEIAPDASHDFSITMNVKEDAFPGAYVLPLKIDYRTSEASFEIDDELDMRINSDAEFEVLDAKSEPQTITAGSSFIVNIPIRNIGQKEAESVKAVIKTKSFFTGVKTDYLGNIAPEGEKTATFELEVDRDTLPDNYYSDITMIWKEGDDRYEEVYSFFFTVTSKSGNGESIRPSGKIAVASAGMFFLVIGGLVIRRKRK